MKTEDFLQKIKAFSALSKSDFLKLCSQTEQKVFEKGQTIFKEGDPSSFVWLVKSGWVHLIRKGSKGTSVILFTMTPYEILCGVSAFDQEPYAADGIAATQCELLRIPTQVFTGFLNENPKFCREILSICSRRIRKMAQKLGSMNDPVSHRIAKVLLASMEDFGKEIPLTHREIAQMVGARTETSIRTFRILREKNFLKIKRACIEIEYPSLLQKELRNWLKVDF